MHKWMYTKEFKAVTTKAYVNKKINLLKIILIACGK